MFLASILLIIRKLQKDMQSVLIEIRRKISLGYKLSVQHNYEGSVLRIDDYSGSLSRKQLVELGTFITKELHLCTKTEFTWLETIEIHKIENTRYDGGWSAKFHKNPNDPYEIIGVSANIVLNSAYLTTLEDFKTTLAHEYGHHWTILYCIQHHGLKVKEGLKDVLTQRLPPKYYQVRELNYQDYAPDEDSKGWYKCDKEIIAEDYRVLFAPSPYNNNHQMVGVEGSTLTAPNEATRLYIKELQKPAVVNL